MDGSLYPGMLKGDFLAALHDNSKDQAAVANFEKASSLRDQCKGAFQRAAVGIAGSLISVGLNWRNPNIITSIGEFGVKSVQTLLAFLDLGKAEKDLGPDTEVRKEYEAYRERQAAKRAAAQSISGP
jgi:hypothetical protein